jgi:hypothetical protein
VGQAVIRGEREILPEFMNYIKYCNKLQISHDLLEFEGKFVIGFNGKTVI